MKAKTLFFYGVALWLAGTGLALAQAARADANSIEAVDVTQQGGKVVVRITTREARRVAAATPPSDH